MKAVVILGSRNPEGQTARAAGAFVEGLESAGGEGESLFLPQMTIERCRQCDERGWGLCRKEGRCTIEDDFATVVGKLREADAAVFAKHSEADGNKLMAEITRHALEIVEKTPFETPLDLLDTIFPEVLEYARKAHLTG